ncbi:MAG: hypothetical protein PHH00_01420 [Candidatus Nanoarchaeia archaeon]|nr:hypothetical protein [Candidatus Nanoarchaeia archaeon]
MNKRGSHIDVILSFVIFISFIIFLYALIQPSLNSKDGKSVFLNYMGEGLVKNLTGKNLTMISILVEPQNPKPCLKLTGFKSNARINSMAIIVKDSSGRTFASYKSGNDLYVDMTPDQNSELFQVYYSPDFSVIGENTLGACNPALGLDNPPNSYSINRAEAYTSYYAWGNNIAELISTYNNDYSSVKDWFNLTAMQNFRFDFTYQNGTVIGTEDNIPLSANVYSEIFPVVYISPNNNLEAGNLIVRVW